MGTGLRWRRRRGHVLPEAHRRVDAGQGHAGQQGGPERPGHEHELLTRHGGRRSPPASGPPASLEPLGEVALVDHLPEALRCRSGGRRGRSSLARRRAPPPGEDPLAGEVLPGPDSRWSSPGHHRVGGDHRAVEGADRGPHDHVGHDVALEQRASMPTWLTAWLPPPRARTRSAAAGSRTAAAPAPRPGAAARSTGSPGRFSECSRDALTVCPAPRGQGYAAPDFQPSPPKPHSSRGGGRPTRDGVLSGVPHGSRPHPCRPRDGGGDARRRPAHPADPSAGEKYIPYEAGSDPIRASASRTSATTCTPCSS